MTMKNFQTPKEIVKVRYIAQGYSYIKKPFMVHDVSVLRPPSIRLLLSVATILNLRLFFHDVDRPYLQSREPLFRDVYIRAKLEDKPVFNLKKDKILKLKKPFYGLYDSGDYWNATIDHHLAQELQISRAVSDPSLFFKIKHGKLRGTIGNYVDDSLLAGDDKFQIDTCLTLNIFESKERICDTFTFFGNQIVTKEPGWYNMSQAHYANQLQNLTGDTTFNHFRRSRSILAWMVHSRRDLAWAANKAAKATEDLFEKGHITKFNKAV